jgi:hypothetical protein
MPNIDLSILNQRQTPAFFADTLANRPAAGFLGRIFVSTDTFAFYRDNGTGWDLIGGPGTGTITGTGASGQIALWNGASTITGDTGLTYDGTANSLTADKFIVSGGTSSQFLKGDGSLDSSTYLTTNIYNGNGTLSGERTISLNGNNLIFDGGSSIARVRMDADTNVARIFSFATNNLPRFAIRIDGTESGSDAGSDFAIRRYNDAGTFVDAPFSINRATGQSTFAKKVVIENNTGDQQLQIVSSTAPSLRIDNLQTGATRRIGIGLATTTNNFIQGTTGGELCLFNSSTTASPILFGVYDAGLTNTQEAARISASRNFIVGSSVDDGNRLQINGNITSTGSLGQTIAKSGTGIESVNFLNLRLSGTNQIGDSQNINFLNNAFNTISRISNIVGDDNVAYGSLAFSTRNYFSDTLVEVMRITNRAYVGISRTNPEFPLDVNGDIALPRTSKLQFTGGTAGDRQRAYITGNPNNDIIVYAASGGVNATFYHSTNTIIGGTTDNGNKLQVVGDAYVSGLGTFTGANLLSGNQYLRSANVPLPHSTTTTVLRFFNNAGNLSGQNAIFGIINIFVGWNAGYNFGSNIYTYSISCSSNGIGVLTLLSSNVVGSSLVTSVTASADGTGCKIDITTNGTSNPLNANSWITFTGNFF